VLHFESATHHATVWVDGTEAVSHEGGYTPFEADITGHVTPGAQARITVEVDNTLTFQTVPPGVVEETPQGKRQRYFHDFFNYSGLHRSVWLYTTSPDHVTDVTVVTDLDGNTGTIHYPTTVAGANGTRVRAVLRDAEGREVTGNDGLAGTLTLPDVHPWAPGHGYLYDLELQLHLGGDLVDSYHQSVGVRTIRVDDTRFLINDEPFYFTGSANTKTFRSSGRATTTLTSCTTSNCCGGSARTPSAPPTTPTAKTSSTTPTATAS